MVQQTLLSQTGITGPGAIKTFSNSDNIKIIQFIPQLNIGFTGTLVIQASNVASPGNNDFNDIATVTFAGHIDNLTIEIDNSYPSIRAVITGSQEGSIAVFANSKAGTVSGGSGNGTNSAIIDSPYRVAGTGQNFKINLPIVPGFTTDDVILSSDFSKTLTQALGTLQPKIGNGNINATENDINLLNGTYVYGLTNADMKKLADVNVTATEINRISGVTSNVQTQLDNISAAINPGLTGVTVSAAAINSFFNTTGTVNIGNLNSFAALTATAADMNVFTGTSGTFTAADLAKLGAIQASAAEISKLSGFTGSSTDLNKLISVTASSADLNVIAGLSGLGISITNLSYLSGLSQNIQTKLNSIPNLSGLTAGPDDLNILTGAFTGTGAYSAQITATEINYLNGLVGNIQSQLNSKRNNSVTIGISEITGSSITTTEFNHLQGVTSNVQAQLNLLNSTKLGTAGGTFVGPIAIADGSAASPSLTLTAPNNTSGFYRYGTNGLGITINGTRAGSFDGSQFIVGTGSTTGGPLLRGTGFAITDPAHSFINDTDTGLAHSGTNSVSIVAGAEEMMKIDRNNNSIMLGGAVASNNSITLTGPASLEKVLSRTTVNAGNITGSLGQISHYTVPTGRTLIVTKVLVRIVGVAGFVSGNTLRMNIGWGGTFDELLDNITNTTVFNPGTYSFSTANQVIILGTGNNDWQSIAGGSGGDYQSVPAGSTIKTNITALQDSATYNLEISIMGYEF